jgi:Fe-S oxidoreductase
MTTKVPKAAELVATIPPDYQAPADDWRPLPVEFKPNQYCFGAKGTSIERLGFANPRDWQPTDVDWKLPANWKETVLKGFKSRLGKFRSFKLFMDVCVRCGACADKCHFFLGTNDPKNMPVVRSELMRSVYRRYFTLGGKLLGSLAGARDLDEGVIKEWYKYYYQCTECRRCSVYCPFGIDTAEITMMGREMLHEIGVGTNWILEPAGNSQRTGNHLGLQPHALKDSLDSLVEDLETITGIKVNPTFNRKGAEILFVTPSADFFADPGIFTMMGYLLLFHHIGLDYTFSTYASEGGNFGLFSSHELMKKLNGKVYAEAQRLGVKWILGGECGHMWRVINQYMSTMTGPADFLQQPVSPMTGTVFGNTPATKYVHIAEFTADLIKHGKLKLDPKRNNHRRITFHDSCNTARGMGLIEEPREVLKAVTNNFFEMHESTTRERTFCCGSGAGLNTNELMEVRMRGGYPRANAVKMVQEKHDVNMLTAICAIDRAVLPALMNYWVPGVAVSGLHELVGNALIMEGESARTVDLRGEDLEASDA